MGERAVRGPEVVMRDQHDREDDPADDRARERDPATGAPGRAAERGPAAAPHADVHHVDVDPEQPSDCRPVSAIQTMKLTLCSSSNGLRCAGPANISSTPVTNTITVVSTTPGASSR